MCWLRGGRRDACPSHNFPTPLLADCISTPHQLDVTTQHRTGRPSCPWGRRAPPPAPWVPWACPSLIDAGWLVWGRGLLGCLCEGETRPFLPSPVCCVCACCAQRAGPWAIRSDQTSSHRVRCFASTRHRQRPREEAEGIAQPPQWMGATGVRDASRPPVTESIQQQSKGEGSSSLRPPLCSSSARLSPSRTQNVTRPMSCRGCRRGTRAHNANPKGRERHNKKTEGIDRTQVLCLLLLRSIELLLLVCRRVSSSACSSATHESNRAQSSVTAPHAS